MTPAINKLDINQINVALNNINKQTKGELLDSSPSKSTIELINGETTYDNFFYDRTLDINRNTNVMSIKDPVFSALKNSSINSNVVSSSIYFINFVGYCDKYICFTNNKFWLITIETATGKILIVKNLPYTVRQSYFASATFCIDPRGDYIFFSSSSGYTQDSSVLPDSYNPFGFNGVVRLNVTTGDVLLLLQGLKGINLNPDHIYKACISCFDATQTNKPIYFSTSPDFLGVYTQGQVVLDITIWKMDTYNNPNNVVTVAKAEAEYQIATGRPSGIPWTARYRDIATINPVNGGTYQWLTMQLGWSDKGADILLDVASTKYDSSKSLFIGADRNKYFSGIGNPRYAENYYWGLFDTRPAYKRNTGFGDYPYLSLVQRTTYHVHTDTVVNLTNDDIKYFKLVNQNQSTTTDGIKEIDSPYFSKIILKSDDIYSLTMSYQKIPLIIDSFKIDSNKLKTNLNNTNTLMSIYLKKIGYYLLDYKYQLVPGNDNSAKRCLSYYNPENKQWYGPLEYPHSPGNSIMLRNRAEWYYTKMSDKSDWLYFSLNGTYLRYNNNLGDDGVTAFRFNPKLGILEKSTLTECWLGDNRIWKTAGNKLLLCNVYEDKQGNLTITKQTEVMDILPAYSILRIIDFGSTVYVFTYNYDVYVLDKDGQKIKTITTPVYFLENTSNMVIDCNNQTVATWSGNTSNPACYLLKGRTMFNFTRYQEFDSTLSTKEGECKSVYLLDTKLFYNYFWINNNNQVDSFFIINFLDNTETMSFPSILGTYDKFITYTPDYQNIFIRFIENLDDLLIVLNSGRTITKDSILAYSGTNQNETCVF